MSRRREGQDLWDDVIVGPTERPVKSGTAGALSSSPVLSLSVVVSVCNERYLVVESLRRVLAAAPSWEGVSAVEVA